MSFGGIYNLNKKGTIRLNLSISVGYSLIRQPINWQKIDNASFLTTNYTFDYEKTSTASLIINPKIEFPVSWIYGFTVSPMLQISKDRTYVGIGIGQMIGLLRKRNN